MYLIDTDDELVECGGYQFIRYRKATKEIISLDGVVAKIETRSDGIGIATITVTDYASGKLECIQLESDIEVELAKLPKEPLVEAVRGDRHQFTVTITKKEQA